MNFRRICSFALASLVAVVVAGLFNAAQAGTYVYDVSVNVADTSLASSSSSGYVALYLDSTTAASPATVAMTVTLQSITNGSLGSVYYTSGTASGDLTTPAGATGDNSNTNSDLFQNYTYSTGATLDFTVTLSGTGIGSGDPNGTSFLLDVGDGISADATASIAVNPTGPPTYGSDPGVTITQTSPVVPEPSSVVLLGLGLGIFAVAGRFRNRRAA